MLFRGDSDEERSPEGGSDEQRSSVFSMDGKNASDPRSNIAAPPKP
jgi:hypothetical protein